jgi:methylated-DNA-[protein]-cysteine S-methyltransferase
MTMRHTFPTAFGPCTLAWSERGLTGVRLEPKGTRTGGDAPPPWVAEVAARVARHLAGDVQDLRDVPLDLDEAPPFFARVWKALRRVPAGRTTTYGELARAAGRDGAARAVGTAMRRNPFLLVVPCHRVRQSGGTLGGFSAPGGASTKAKLLALEGVT